MFHNSECNCNVCLRKLTDEESRHADELSGIIQETWTSLGCYPNELAEYLIKSGYQKKEPV